MKFVEFCSHILLILLWGPVQAPPRCTKCNSPPINGQCTNFIYTDKLTDTIFIHTAVFGGGSKSLLRV